MVGGFFGPSEDETKGGRKEEWKGSVVSRSHFPLCVFVLYIIADKISLENIRTVCETLMQPGTRPSFGWR